MFSGIVERTGRIVETRAVSGGRRLCVDAGPIGAEAKPGDSICVQGICLTVADIEGDRLHFDVITETLNRTNLGQKKAGDRVNLERSLRLSDRVDGHFVQGHVESTARVLAVRSSEAEYVVRLEAPEALLRFLIPKGSVALDGVSLTLSALDRPAFEVALIPTTLERTTLGTLRVGEAVNVETDMLVRAVVERLEQLSLPGLGSR